MLPFPSHDFLSAKLHIILWIAKNERKSDWNLYHPSHIKISVSTLQNTTSISMLLDLVIHGTILPIYLLYCCSCSIMSGVFMGSAVHPFIPSKFECKQTDNRLHWHIILESRWRPFFGNQYPVWTDTHPQCQNYLDNCLSWLGLLFAFSLFPSSIISCAFIVFKHKEMIL